MNRLTIKLIREAQTKVCFSFGGIYYYPEKIDLTSKTPSFKASDLTIVKTNNPQPKPPVDAKVMLFGKYHTDHLFEVDWDATTGWGKPQIVPFHNFQIHPFASCLHYAIECFEGTKAYISKCGEKIRWFRPDANMFRMKKTAQRISLPDFDGEEYIKCIQELLKLDKDWIPKTEGFSAYIRPTFIATEESLGVKAANKAKLFAVISPVGPYFPTGFKPVKMLCNTSYVRASPGGMGEYKVGGNYGPTIKSLKEIQEQGFSQSLWALPDGQIQEIGVCNLFFYWKNKQGEKELITPILDGTILPGVTRDSVLKLCSDMNQFKITQRKLYINEIIEAHKENRLYEMFGSGTAVSILPIKALGYKDQIYKIDVNPKFQAGDLTHKVYESLTQIQLGDIQHPWVYEC